jgi:tetratricopeptide (TPR) repeat protein
MNCLEQSLAPAGRIFFGVCDPICGLPTKLQRCYEHGIQYCTKIQPESPTTHTKKTKSTDCNYFDAERHKSKTHHEIESLIHQQKYVKAIKLVDDMLQPFKYSPHLLRQKAQCLIALNDISTAKDYLQLSLAHATSDPKNLFLLGLCFFNQGEDEHAIEYFDRALKIKNNFPECYFFKAQIAFQQQQKKQAMTFFKIAKQQVARIDPKQYLLSCPSSMHDLIAIIDNEIEQLKGELHE